MLTSLGGWPQPKAWGWGLGRPGEGSLAGRDAHGVRTDQRLFALQRTNSLGVELTVRTDEGDTVTLSFQRETESLALRYGAKSRGPEGREAASLSLRSASVSQEVSMQVEGSLSEAELADIERLASRITASLASGRGAGAAAFAAGDASEFESLAGFSLDVTRERSLELTMIRLREQRLAAPTVAPLPVQPAPLEPVAGPTVAPSPFQPAPEPVPLEPVADAGETGGDCRCEPGESPLR